MKTKTYLILLLAALCCMYSCKENSRFATQGDDTVPPSPPTIKKWIPLNGGARFFYTLPDDEDLLSINGEYTNAHGTTYFFTSSYYNDSLDVIGLGDTTEHIIKIYSVDRAGNRSQYVEQKIKPLEPAVSRVSKTLVLKAGFSSFFVDWTNELLQNINVYIMFKYTDNGTPREIISVFSSNQPKERRFINDLYLAPTDPIDVSIMVEDMYGNSSGYISFGQIFLQEDYELDKSKWVIPNGNDSTVVVRGKIINTGVPAMFGDNLEGRMSKLIDGIIDRGDNLNFFHTGGRGHTGFSKDGNMPWNIIIDLGDYYQLSRIKTVQRHSGGLDNISRGQYYRSENCGEFCLYVFNDETEKWDSISTQRTPIPVGISELEYVRLGEAGDMTYFYPDEPQYTRAARWFRYEALHCFDDNYTSTGANCMSELTLYGRKAQ